MSNDQACRPKSGGFNSHDVLQLENIMKRILEIRPAEGGDDSKLFASDLAAAYLRLAGKLG